MKFEISETPTLENTSTIEKEAVMMSANKELKGTTKVLKVKINGEPFYHFSLGEFDDELATKSSSVKIGGKTFYKGKIDKRMKVRLSLNSLV